MYTILIDPLRDCLLEDVLITPKHALSQQVHDHYLPKLIHHSPSGDDVAEKEIAVRNLLYNVDGTGVAYYTPARNDFESSVTGLRPCLYKTTTPPLADFNFRSICANTATKVCFAHIRATSGSVVTPVNNHPFCFGRHTFMHNGSVSDFSAIRRAICDELDLDTYSNVLGSTDSEHVAGLYIHYLTSGRGKDAWQEEFPADQMAAALRKAVGFVIDAQKKILGAKRRPNSLNLAVTDGRRLVCFRFRNSETEQPPSLYYSTTAGVTLNRKYPDHPNKGESFGAEAEGKSREEHGKHVIVASEPTTYKEDEWELIEKNCCVMVETGGQLEVLRIPMGEDWNAEDEGA